MEVFLYHPRTKPLLIITLSSSPLMHYIFSDHNVHECRTKKEAFLAPIYKVLNLPELHFRQLVLHQICAPEQNEYFIKLPFGNCWGNLTCCTFLALLNGAAGASTWCQKNSDFDD